MIPSLTSTTFHDITGRGRVHEIKLPARSKPPEWAGVDTVILLNGEVRRVVRTEMAVGMDGLVASTVGLIVAPLAFTSLDTYVIDRTTLPNPGPRLTVYTVLNPTDVEHCDDWAHLIVQTVLIDGVERKVAGVESYRLGGPYRAGRPIGLAVEDSL